MKNIYVCLLVTYAVFSCITSWADFLPQPNWEPLGLQYGESICGFIENPPQIDGNLDDWKYAIWVSFDSVNELFRGAGAWKGKDDLTLTWSTMYDNTTFYFAAAVRDDKFAPSGDAAQPWLGDTIFLYIDWAGAKAEVSSKPTLAKIKGKASVFDFSAAAKNPRLAESKIAIIPNALLGKGGMIYEVAMPFEFMTNEKIVEGKVIGFTPGYEEGTDNPEGKGGMIFMVWGAVNPDEAKNLGKIKFGGALSVTYIDKLASTWGKTKLERIDK
jgi:hypothetical protein